MHCYWVAPSISLTPSLSPWPLYLFHIRILRIFEIGKAFSLSPGVSVLDFVLRSFLYCCTPPSHKMGYVMNIWFSNRLSSIMSYMFVSFSTSHIYEIWQWLLFKINGTWFTCGTSNNNNSKIRTADTAYSLLKAQCKKSFDLYCIWIIISYFL